MSKFIRLVDALEDVSFTCNYINYKGKNARAKIAIPKDKTGFKRQQTIHADSVDKWHPVKLEGKPCLIGEPSSEKLVLSGEAGFKNGITIMEEAVKIWENPSIHACARPVTKD